MCRRGGPRHCAQAPTHPPSQSPLRPRHGGQSSACLAGRSVAELEAKIAGLEAALATAEREADPSEPIDPKHGLRGEYDRMVWRDSRERHAASLRQMLIPLRRELADQLEVLAVVDEIDRACAELAKSAEAAQ